MILQLNPEIFLPFGIILPSAANDPHLPNLHGIPLSPTRTAYYQSTGHVTLLRDKGRAILSVSTDGQSWQDFYLNRPVRLAPGIHFGLTAIHSDATVSCAGWSMPRLIRTTQAAIDPSTRPSLSVTEIVTFLYQEKEQGFLFPGESHSMLELTYVDRGSLHSVCDGQELHLQQGQLTLYGPHAWHMQYADTDVAPRFVTITFQVNAPIAEKLCGRILQPSPRVVQLLQVLHRERDLLDPYSPDMMVHTLSLLLNMLLREAETPTPRHTGSNTMRADNEVIRRAQQYITANVRGKLTVPGVAQAVEVSASYLTALFHKHLQLSPGEYIRRIKLQESKQLIREGAMNFTEIAEALQYSTVHHFSRQFKEKFGLTPTEYARSVR